MSVGRGPQGSCWSSTRHGSVRAGSVRAGGKRRVGPKRGAVGRPATRGRPPRARHGLLRSAGVLGCPIYRGRVRCGRGPHVPEWPRGRWEPLVDDTTWERAQQRVALHVRGSAPGQPTLPADWPLVLSSLRRADARECPHGKAGADSFTPTDVAEFTIGGAQHRQHLCLAGARSTTRNGRAGPGSAPGGDRDFDGSRFARRAAPRLAGDPGARRSGHERESDRSAGAGSRACAAATHQGSRPIRRRRNRPTWLRTFTGPGPHRSSSRRGRTGAPERHSPRAQTSRPGGRAAPSRAAGRPLCETLTWLPSAKF